MMKKSAVAILFSLALAPVIFAGSAFAQSNPGFLITTPAVAGDCVKLVDKFHGQTAGAPCAAGISAANPTATAGPAAVNGVATTFMRSDGAPAVQKGTAAQFGIVECDATTITCPIGVLIVSATTFGGQSVSPGGSATVQGNGAKIQLSTGAATSGDCVKFDANGNTVANGAACPTQSSGANPTATAGSSAINGVATTFMRSDAAPAVSFANTACSPTRAGDLIYWNGAAWVCFAGNNSGNKILQESSTGVPSWVTAGTGTTVTVASGTKALATTSIASAACSSAQTATATGTLTTDAITVSFNGDPTAVTGYVPLTTGMLTIIPYPTADTVNFKVCNNTGAAITPGAITLNWYVAR